MKRAVCYLPENQPQDLDHLLPLALELDLPVITRSEKKHALVQEYYPHANLQWVSPVYPLDMLSDSPVIISTLPRYELDLALFLESTLYGHHESVYCHHGLSDKQLQGNQYKNLHTDQKVLVYGDKTKREIPPHCDTFCVGNYRKHHFSRLKNLYDSKIDASLKTLKPDVWTLLFAPSWLMKTIHHPADLFGSFLENSLLSTIPLHIQIIFKPHPYLLKQLPTTLEKIKQACTSTPNLLYLEEMPYIYPLLDRVDAYLGDMSSIGYDFLTTTKPIFTLAKETRSPLQEIALKAPLSEGKIDWNLLFREKDQWNPLLTHPLLEESFGKVEPLCNLRESFFEFIQ